MIAPLAALGYAAMLAEGSRSASAYAPLKREIDRDHSCFLFGQGDTYVGLPLNQSLDGKYARQLVAECAAQTSESACQSEEEFQSERTPAQIAFAAEWGEKLQEEIPCRWSSDL